MLDGVCDKGSAAVLEQFLPDCPLSSLSLRDNGLEQDAIKLFAALRSLEHLTLLDIGGSNFTALRSNKKYSSTLSKALTELVKLISAENCVSIFCSSFEANELLELSCSSTFRVSGN